MAQSKDITKRFALVLAILAVIGAAAWIVSIKRAVDSPGVFYLKSEGGAAWIKEDAPLNPGTWKPGPTAVALRKRFSVDAPPKEAVLKVRALRDSSVLLDGRTILMPSKDLKSWQEARTVDLAPYLSPGGHELIVIAMNEDGPSLALAFSEPLGLFTGPGWEASLDLKEWRPAVTADTVRPPEIAEGFPGSADALSKNIIPFAVIFSAVFALTLLSGRGRISVPLPPASSVRWALMAGLAILGVNDIVRLPYDSGFDVTFHLDYVRYVADRYSIPLANEGWQMFQSPLYYIVSAPLYALLSGLMPFATAVKFLKIIPVACGVLMADVAYRTVREVYPDRQDLIILGTIVGGLLPMNLYMTQHIGNEPLAALLTALAILSALRLLNAPADRLSRQAVITGVFTGLSLLTKVSVILIIPVLSFLVLYAVARRYGLLKGLKGLGLFYAAAAAISLWYYARNWVYLGRPFVGGWENTPWSQDPGYRVIGHFTNFGEAVSRPVYSGVYGLWDSLYSTFWMDGFLSSVMVYEYAPQWNYGLLIGGALLALVPAALMFTGFIYVIARPFRSLEDGAIFPALFVISFLAGLAMLYLKVPIYAGAKATYMLGLAPSFALLFVSGARIFLNKKLPRAALYGLISVWACAAYGAYFVLR